MKTKTKLKRKNNWKTKTKTKNKSKRKSHCHSVVLLKCGIKVLEKMQKNASKIQPNISHLKYCHWLKARKLRTVHYRRIITLRR